MNRDLEVVVVRVRQDGFAESFIVDRTDLAKQMQEAQWIAFCTHKRPGQRIKGPNGVLMEDSFDVAAVKIAADQPFR